jgi:hypothetical protein
MVRSLAAGLLLAAVSVSVSASPAIPSFEFSAAQLQSSIAALRAAQVKTKAGDIGPRLSNMAWDLERAERDASRLQNDLRFLMSRVRRHQPPVAGRPDNDPSLRWDVQRLTRDLSQLARNSQQSLYDLRFLSSEAVKDQNLVAPATRLSDAASRFQSATNWLLSDARFAYFDLMRAGFTFEGMDLDRDSRDVDGRAQDLRSEADRLLAKVRP